MQSSRGNKIENFSLCLYYKILNMFNMIRKLIIIYMYCIFWVRPALIFINET